MLYIKVLFLCSTGIHCIPRLHHGNAFICFISFFFARSLNSLTKYWSTERAFMHHVYVLKLYDLFKILPFILLEIVCHTTEIQWF